MHNKQQIELVIKTLENSDIVWSRYGSDTIQELAERIMKALNKTGEKYMSDKWKRLGKAQQEYLRALENLCVVADEMLEPELKKCQSEHDVMQLKEEVRNSIGSLEGNLFVRFAIAYSRWEG